MDNIDNNVSDNSHSVRFKAVTYLAPNLPIEYFLNVIDYLKCKLGYIDTSLVYETQWKDAEKAFVDNEIDFAWLNSTNYTKLEEKKVVSLLPVSSVHLHANAEHRPAYYADFIVHNSMSSIKEFADLRGKRFAYNPPDSLSGNIVVLNKLKQIGETRAFFGDTVESQTHLQSIYMVLNQHADAACVDSNCLQIFMDRNPNYRKHIKVIESWGPLPPYPMVVNIKMPQYIKDDIVNALLNAHFDASMKAKLNKFYILKFAPISEQDFVIQKQLIDYTSDINFESINI